MHQAQCLSPAWPEIHAETPLLGKMRDNLPWNFTGHDLHWGQCGCLYSTMPFWLPCGKISGEEGNRTPLWGGWGDWLFWFAQDRRLLVLNWPLHCQNGDTFPCSYKKLLGKEEERGRKNKTWNSMPWKLFMVLSETCAHLYVHRWVWLVFTGRKKQLGGRSLYIVRETGPSELYLPPSFWFLSPDSFHMQRLLKSHDGIINFNRKDGRCDFLKIINVIFKIPKFKVSLYSVWYYDWLHRRI